MHALFYDTETTGIPDWGSPSEGATQPHIVQLAAILTDLETMEDVGTMNTLIIPNGWEWDDANEAFLIHGITAERARIEGIPEVEAVEKFFELWNRDDEAIRVGHNESFDRRMIRIATKRYPELAHHEHPWYSVAKERSFCTANKSTKAMGKRPKLAAAYLHFTGEELEGAHDAMADAQACRSIYLALNDENP